jgi:hypothetical protein
MHIDTYVEVEDIEAYVEDKLKNAPKITGSERDADIFVNAEPGRNISVSKDCARCDYGGTIRSCEDGGFECDADDDYRCPYGTYQSRAVITVCGDLRDRTVPPPEGKRAPALSAAGKAFR